MESLQKVAEKQKFSIAVNRIYCTSRFGPVSQQLSYIYVSIYINRKRNCGRNKNGQKIKVLVVTTILGGSVAIGQHTTLASWWLTGVKRPKQRCGQVQSFYICCVELLVCWFFGSGSIAAFMNCRRSFFLDVISPSFALSIWPEGDKEQKLWPVNFQRDANNPSLHFNRPRVEEKNWQTEVDFSIWQRERLKCCSQC